MSKKPENIENLENEQDLDYDYDKNMLVIDKVTEKLIDKLEELYKKDDLASEKAMVVSKVLKNVTSAKKNILKADLLNIELDDCLYDEFEDDEEIDDEPIQTLEEFEESVDDDSEVEEKSKKTKKHSKGN